jgi:hypothetical protein
MQRALARGVAERWRCPERRSGARRRTQESHIARISFSSATGAQIAVCLVYDALDGGNIRLKGMENAMASNAQDHVVDEVRHGNAPERHVFHTIENIGKSDDDSDWKQRIAAIVIAVVICTGLYGVLYLAMHFQK